MKQILMELTIKQWESDEALKPYLDEAKAFLSVSPSGALGHDSKAIKDIASMLVINQLKKLQEAN
jgi:hypothetical protein